MSKSVSCLTVLLIAGVAYGVPPTTAPVDDALTVALWHFDVTESVQMGPDVWETRHPDDDSFPGNEGRDRYLIEHSTSDAFIDLVSGGKFGNAVDFDDCGNAYKLYGASWPEDKGTFIYEGWIKFEEGDTGGYLCHVYDQVYLYTSGTASINFKIIKNGIANPADPLYDPCGIVDVTANLPTTNEWQYIEAIYDGATMQLITEAETVSADGVGEFTPNRRNIYVGCRKNKNPYTGLMDEVKLSWIPEPATLALLGIGGLLLRRKRR